jgi:hydrogenase maturation factor
MSVCVALAGRVEWIGERSITSVPGRVCFGDAAVETELLLVPEVTVGDYVTVHAGYAVAVVPADAVADNHRLFGEVFSPD